MAKKFPLDLAKFKKTEDDGSYATLKHASGHQLRIAKYALSPEHREMLNNLETVKPKGKPEQQEAQAETKMADGGKIPGGNGSPAIDSKKAKAMETTTSGDPIYEGAKSAINSLISPEPKKMADGGDPAPGGASGEWTPPTGTQTGINNGGYVPSAPDPVQIQSEQASAPLPPVVAPQAIPGQETPNLQHGYSQALKAGQQEVNAIKEKSGAEAQAAKDQQEMLTPQFLLAGKANALIAEQQHALKTWQEQPEINEGRLMANRSTGSKIANAIGLLAGGMSSGTLGGENPAVKAINENIARDIDQQKANLSNKQSLFQAYNHILGNAKDAQAMTAAVMSQKYANDIKLAAANAATPMARAEMLKQASNMEMQAAPAFQQMAMRQTLMDMRNTAGPLNMDPAQLVQYYVPAEHQKQAFTEIDRAKDTRNMGESIMTAFDNAAKDARVMSGGHAKNLLPGVSSPYVKSLHQAMQPTFKDLEGTVRQAAMDNTFHNVTPQAFDSDQTVAVKRQALEQYLRSKSSSATFEGTTGLPLDRFKSASEPRSQAPAGAQIQSGGRVPVIGPNGEHGSVPKENLERALANGYRLK